MQIQFEFSGLFDDGQEYQYSYISYTTSGVKEPTPYGSSFGIRANLLVQKKAGEAVVKVTFPDFEVLKNKS